MQHCFQNNELLKFINFSGFEMKNAMKSKDLGWFE